jgi:hypothetical protein
MNASARLYHCARCHAQVILCRRCDRGNVYCANGCAFQARTLSQRRAACRYRSTRRGRLRNAERQHRFRARQQQKVTHQGSPPQFELALLCLTLNRQAMRQELTHGRSETALHCHVCHRVCDPFLRRDFLRPPERGKPNRLWR